jgi:putative DNA primase/helicase
MDFSAEAVLLRRKAYWHNRFRPVPIDRDGNPAGARWVEEAMADPPAATVRPVDRNSPFTAVMVRDLIVFELGATAPDLADRLVQEVVRLAGPTPLVRRSPGAAGLFYRGRPPYGSLGSGIWRDDAGESAAALVIGDGHAALVELCPIDHSLFEWPGGRPDEVALDALPELDEPAAVVVAVEAVLRAFGYRLPASLLDDVEIEEIPRAHDPPPRPEPRAEPPQPPPDRPEPPPPEPPDGPSPDIVVYAGDRHRAADEGLKALYRLRTRFFNRGGELVRVVGAPLKDAAGRTITVPMIGAVPLPALGRALNQAASWFRPKGKGRYRVDVPAPVVEMIAGMGDEWRFPPLVGIVRTPCLRPDLSLLTEPGYDRASGLYADFGNLKMPRIAARPTRREAETAMTLLLQTLDNFPFVEARDRAVAVAEMITVVVRRAVPVVPGLAISSPGPGSGKSFLTDCLSAVATGWRAAVIAVSSKEEETEKRLIGAALAGDQLIVLDNVRRLLEGDFLCQVTERPIMELRPLGTSDLRRIENIYILIANGNNIVTAADLARRFLRISIDPNCERPELREFDSNPLQTILDHRGDFIAAGLTIVRYYIGAGRPNLWPRFGSYGEWSDLVRSAVCHLGLPDPLQTQADLIAEDPAAAALRQVFGAWSGLKTLGLGDPRGFRVRDLIEEAQHDEELFGALLEVADGQGGNSGKLDHARLTRWLARHENRITGGLKLVVDRHDKSRPRWRLEPMLPDE